MEGIRSTEMRVTGVKRQKTKDKGQKLKGMMRTTSMVLNWEAGPERQ